MNKKATKQSLLASVLALVLCVAMLVGTTFAWFTDTASTSVNKIQAGNLDVDIVDETGASLDGKILYFRDKDDNTDILWEPGATFQLDSFKIANKGNLALKYKVVINGVDGDAKLLEAIDFTVKTGNAEPVSLAGWDGYLLANKETDLITISGAMKKEAGNEYQGLKLSGIGIVVYATQYTYENDSMSNTYDENAVQDEFKQGVTVRGIAGFENREFATIQEAYNAIKPSVETLAGLEQETCSDGEFDALFTDGGVITWTIYGNQTVSDKLTFSFGRKASYYGERDLTAINIVAGNSSATLNVNGSFALPYNWWEAHEVNTALYVKGIVFNGITSVPANSYANPTSGTNITFDSCTFNGNLYSYHNYKVDLTIENCIFNAPADTDYAFHCQGANGGTVKFLNNRVSGYMRGINLERPNTEFIVKGNTFVNLLGKTENGFTYGSAIQMTRAKSIEVIGNTIVKAPVNALHLYKGCNADSITIKDNVISAEYLCWNQADDSDVIYDTNKITSSGNTVRVTNTGKCATKTGVISSDFTLN